MPNPTLHSDILKDDGAFDDAIAKLEKLGKAGVEALDKIKKSAGQLEAELEGVSVASNRNNDKIGETAKHTAKLEAEYQKLTDTLSENGKQLALLREGKLKANQIAKAEARLVLAAEGSYDQLSAKYSLIKIRLNAMSDAQRENTKEGRALVQTSKDIYQEMIRLQVETGKHTLKVGDYSGALKDTNRNLGELKQELVALRNVSFEGKSAEEIALLNKRIGETVDQIDDLRAHQKSLGTETGQLVAGSLQFFVAGLEGVAAATKLIGIESPVLDKLQRNIIELIAISQALAAIEDVLAKKTLQTTFARIGNSIATAKDTIVKAANVFTTNAAIRAEEAKAVALTRGAVVTRAIAAAQWLWNAALAANPIGLVITAVLLLTTAVTAYAVAQKESNEQLQQEAANRRINNELSQQAAINAVDEKVKSENLIAILKDKNSTNIEQKKAYEELVKLGPEYYKGLTLEKDGVEAVAKAYTEKYLPALERRVKFEAATQRLIDIEKKLLDTTTQLAETKPGLFDAGVAYFKNFGNAVDASKDLVNEWTVDMEENRKALEDDKQAVLNFIQANDLATVALDTNTESTKDNTNAKKDAADANEKAAIQAARDLAFQRELNALLAEEGGMLAELAGNGKKFADEFERSIQGGLSGASGIDALPNIFDANARKDILKRAGELGKGVGDGLTDGIKESALDRLKDGESIYDLLGIDMGDDGKAAMKTAFQTAKDELFAFAAFRTQIANQNVENSNREVEEAQKNLEIQLQNQDAGSASRIKSAEKELEEAKKRQAKALAEQQKAQRAERRLQTIQQAANLVTASAKIWGQLGFPAALPALAIMWGSFIASKVRANQLAKSANRKGTYLDLDFGDSHESGNDIPFGVTKDGKRILTAERGESMAVFTAQARRKYGSTLPMLVDAINRNKAEIDFGRIAGEGVTDSEPTVVAVSGGNPKMEGYLKTIADNSGKETKTVMPDGRVITTYKNQTTIARI